jgi:hypothetical protein
MSYAYLTITLAAFALAACQSASPARANAQGDRAPISGATIPRRDVANATAPHARDECNAAAYKYLVGKNKSELPAKPANAIWRIACTSCAVTTDYAPARLNIFFDTKSAVIKEVRCG